MCDVEKAIDYYEDSEYKMYKEQKERLFKKEMKETFHANLDDLHKQFLDKYFKEYSNTNDTDIYLIKDIFDYLKTTI